MRILGIDELKREKGLGGWILFGFCRPMNFKQKFSSYLELAVERKTVQFFTTHHFRLNFFSLRFFPFIGNDQMELRALG